MTKRVRSEKARLRRKAKERTRRAILRARTTHQRGAPSFHAKHDIGLDTADPTLIVDTGTGQGREHPADRRAIDLYKLAFQLAEAESTKTLGEITDGTARASACNWVNLKESKSSHALGSRPELTRIRKLFDEATDKFFELDLSEELSRWVGLSRDEQGQSQEMWKKVAPWINNEAASLRTDLCDLLGVETPSVDGCDMQEEDVALLDEILQHGGVNIGIESPVHESGWWPTTSDSHEPENNEGLSYFASDSWRNYCSAELLEESLMEYHDSEVAKGFMEDLPCLPPGGIVSRIAAIEKKNGGVRVIDDLRRSEVNSRVCTEETIQLPGASTTALILQRIHEAMTTGPGYRRGDIVCIETDVASAFRHIPIRPADRKYCVNCINTPSGPRLLAHKRLPFGLRSSPLLWVRPCASEARLAKRIFAKCDNRAEGLQLHIDDRNYFCLR
ncbi:hypothetical protein FOZ63_008620, partial [Perkinsus olseni]